MSVKHILFVCTGNSCRSVMSEYLLRHLLQREGMNAIHVESAGAFAIEGMGPTRETQRVLQDVGIDCVAHRARALTREMIERAELILVMEQFHLDEVLQRLPSASNKVHLLKPYGLAPHEVIGYNNIPDPIGKPLEVYEVCFAQIRDALNRLAGSLKG